MTIVLKGSVACGPDLFEALNHTLFQYFGEMSFGRLTLSKDHNLMRIPTDHFISHNPNLWIIMVFISRHDTRNKRSFFILSVELFIVMSCVGLEYDNFEIKTG